MSKEEIPTTIRDNLVNASVKCKNCCLDRAKNSVYQMQLYIWVIQGAVLQYIWHIASGTFCLHELSIAHFSVVIWPNTWSDPHDLVCFSNAVVHLNRAVGCSQQSM